MDSKNLALCECVKQRPTLMVCGDRVGDKIFIDLNSVWSDRDNSGDWYADSYLIDESGYLNFIRTIKLNRFQVVI